MANIRNIALVRDYCGLSLNVARDYLERSHSRSQLLVVLWASENFQNYTQFFLQQLSYLLLFFDSVTFIVFFFLNRRLAAYPLACLRLCIALYFKYCELVSKIWRRKWPAVKLAVCAKIGLNFMILFRQQTHLYFVYISETVCFGYDQFIYSS